MAKYLYDLIQDLMLTLRQTTNNFLEMPGILQAMVVDGVAVFVISLLFPSCGAGVFGGHVSAYNWWISGAGLAIAIPTALIFYSTCLLLFRDGRGRWMYVAGCFMLSAGAYVASEIEHMTIPMLGVGTLFNMAVAAVVVAYIYMNSAVKAYFNKHG